MLIRNFHNFVFLYGVNICLHFFAEYFVCRRDITFDKDYFFHTVTTEKKKIYVRKINHFNIKSDFFFNQWESIILIVSFKFIQN